MQTLSSYFPLGKLIIDAAMAHSALMDNLSTFTMISLSRARSCFTRDTSSFTDQRLIFNSADKIVSHSTSGLKRVIHTRGTSRGDFYPVFWSKHRATLEQRQSRKPVFDGATRPTRTTSASPVDGLTNHGK